MYKTNRNKVRLAQIFERTGLNTGLIRLQRTLWRQHARAVNYHDVEPMPNGNVLLIAWELKTAAEAIDRDTM